MQDRYHDTRYQMSDLQEILICRARFISLGYNKYNPYCLADDMLEPFRSFVDEIVFDIYLEEGTTKVQFTQSIKKKLLKVLTVEVIIKEMSYPFLESLHLMAASAVKCFGKEQKKLAIAKRPS